MLNIEPGDHLGASIGTYGEFLTAAAKFAGHGVAHGAQVLVFPRTDAIETTAAALAASGEINAQALRRGALQVADSRHVQLATGTFDPVHLRQAYAAATESATTAGYSGLWTAVDMSWAARADPNAVAEFEASSFPLFSGRQLTALCLYDRRAFSDEAIDAACQAHPASPAAAKPLRHERMADKPGLRLSGETDLSNRAAFAALVNSLTSGETLDITAMSFIDAYGMAHIVATTGSRRICLRASGLQQRILTLITAAQSRRQ
jgi:hypothetical protein